MKTLLDALAATVVRGIRARRPLGGARAALNSELRRLLYRGLARPLNGRPAAVAPSGRSCRRLRATAQPLGIPFAEP